MKPNNTITKYYQFIGECLAFYFLLVPIDSSFLYSKPLWNYLIAIIFSIVLFTLSTHLVKSYIIYIVDFAILLLFLIYIIEFSVFTSLILGGFLVWRFIVHESEVARETQLQLIRWMLLLFAIDIIFFYDPKLIWMAIIYLVIIVIGYQLSHIFVGSEKNIYPSLKYPLWLIGIILVGSLLLFSFFQFSNLTLTSIWNRIVSIWSVPPPQLKVGNGEETFIPTKTGYPPSDVPEFVLGIGQLIIILILIGVIVFLVRKKAIHQSKGSMSKIFSSTRIKETEPAEKVNRKSFFNGGNSNKPTNQIRRKVYQFEQLAKRKGKGRETSETIENWFDRHGVDTSYLDLYQKVRYSDGDLNAEEALQFEEELAEIKKKMDL